MKPEISKIKFKPAVLELLGETLKNRLIDVKCVIRECSDKQLASRALHASTIYEQMLVPIHRILSRIERNTRPAEKIKAKVKHSIQPITLKR